MSAFAGISKECKSRMDNVITSSQFFNSRADIGELELTNSEIDELQADYYDLAVMTAHFCSAERKSQFQNELTGFLKSQQSVKVAAKRTYNAALLYYIKESKTIN